MLKKSNTTYMSFKISHNLFGGVHGYIERNILNILN